MRRLLFAVVAICAAVFLFSIDRWGQKAVLKVILSSIAPSKTHEKVTKQRHRQGQDFPDNFLIGTASSAYQIEGGWNAKGKTPSIWDDFVHSKPKVVVDNSTGDIGCDSFHNYQEDIAALKLVGVSSKRAQ
jgi:Glycosyl hydrolase family 1